MRPSEATPNEAECPGTTFSTPVCAPASEYRSRSTHPAGLSFRPLARSVASRLTFTAAWFQPLAFGAVDAAIKLAKKEPVETKDKINNGKKDVPALLFEPVAVDKSNVDSTIIKDGYHSHKDIYGQ